MPWRSAASPLPDGYADRRRLTAGTAMPTLVPGLAIELETLLA